MINNEQIKVENNFTNELWIYHIILFMTTMILFL